MAIYTNDDVIQTLMTAALGSVVTEQIVEVVNDPSTIYDQNPNAIRMGLDWLSNVSFDDFMEDRKSSLGETAETWCSIVADNFWSWNPGRK